MEEPTPCARCGELIELRYLRHDPDCGCDPFGSCGNLICPDCHNDIQSEEEEEY
jgi:hypothetical protein